VTVREYGEVELPTDLGEHLLETPPCVPLEVFSRLPTKGRAFTVAGGDGYFRDHRAWRYSDRDAPGRNRADNHFQGVQRMGDTLIISAGDWNEPAAHLLVVALEEGDEGLPVGGRLEKVFAIDTVRPHAGGIQRLGELLGVPLEGGGDGRSEVRFLRVANPRSPAFVGGDSAIVRRNPKASAVGMSRLPDGRLLIGVAWSDFLDLYLTKTARVQDGYVQQAAEAVPPGEAALPLAVTLDLRRPEPKRPYYQAITLFPAVEWRPAGAAQPGVRVPMLGFRNTSQSVSNWRRGKNFADFFELRIPAERLADWTGGPEVTVGPLMSKQFFAGSFDGNFCAAAGIDVLSDDGCALYAVHHYRRKGDIRLTEYRTDPI